MSDSRVKRKYTKRNKIVVAVPPIDKKEGKGSEGATVAEREQSPVFIKSKPEVVKPSSHWWQIFGQQKSPAGTVACLNIYPREKGGIKVEFMKPEDVNILADTWQCTNNGKTYKVQVWDKKPNTLVAFRLSDTIAFQPGRLARMKGCDPMQRLKSSKRGLLERLAPFAPVAVIVVGLIILLAMTG